MAANPGVVGSVWMDGDVSIVDAGEKERCGMGQRLETLKGGKNMGPSISGKRHGIDRSGWIRVVTGVFPPEIRDRINLVKAQRFVKFQQRESVEDVVQRAVEVGLAVLERDVSGG